MSKNSVKIPLDVLSYWYQSAVQAKERYEEYREKYGKAYKENPSNEERIRQREIGYRMALKTIDALKDVCANVEIIESEKKENEN